MPVVLVDQSGMPLKCDTPDCSANAVGSHLVGNAYLLHCDAHNPFQLGTSGF